MKQIVNFKIIEGVFFEDGFLPEVNLINIDSKVWAELPIGRISILNVDAKRLFLAPGGDLLTEKEARVVIDNIKNQTKVFKFSVTKEGKLKEDEEGTIIKRLPRDVDVERLEYINGEVLMLELEEQNG